MKFNNKQIKKRIDTIVGEDKRKKNRKRMKLLSIMVTVLACLLVITFFVGAGAFKQIINNSPSVDNLDSIKPNEAKSIIYASDGSVMQELIQSGSNRESVSYDQMPKNLINAFVAIEDARFFDHDGVDVKGILRALFVGLSSGRLSEGASTLTQQLIKNNIFKGGLETNFGDRIERKLQEQYLALKVEKEVDKKSILQYYLNTINLGQNCLGVEVAAKRYFGKDVSELDLQECTVLAAITQNPSKYNPITHPEENQKRRETVLQYMLDSGYINNKQYKKALKKDVYDRIQVISNALPKTKHAFSYFTDTVFEDVVQHLEDDLGYSDTQAYNMMYSGGLRIYTTMDPEIQQVVDEEINNPENYIVTVNGDTTNYLEYTLSYSLTIELPDKKQYTYNENNVLSYYQNKVGDAEKELTFKTREELMNLVTEYRNQLLAKTSGTVVSEVIIPTIEPQTSVVIMDQTNGHVLAINGGRGNKDEMGSLILNRATTSKRQPGSTFKIVSTYAPALDIGGASLATTYYDSPKMVNDRYVSNWWGSQYMGYSNIRFAIMASMNVVAVKCLEQTVTMNTGYEYAERFGISTLTEKDKTPLLSLGGLTYGATNLEMTAAYASIANEGYYTSPVFWTKITDANGNLILKNEPKTRTVLKKSTAKLLTSAMESTVSPQFPLWPEYGVGATNQQCKVEGLAVAGKSGTSSDANDLWFIGYSPYYTMGIWSGYDSKRVFGSSPEYHKEIWRKVMSRVHEDYPQKDFDYSGLDTATICSKSGLLARNGVCDCSGDPNCHVYTEYFLPGMAPKEYCNRHSAYRICTVSNGLASPFCPPSVVANKVFLSIDPADEDGSVTDDTKYCLTSNPAWSTCGVHDGSKPTSDPTDKKKDKNGKEETKKPSKPENSSEATSSETTSKTEASTETTGETTEATGTE